MSVVPINEVPILNSHSTVITCSVDMVLTACWNVQMKLTINGVIRLVTNISNIT